MSLKHRFYYMDTCDLSLEVSHSIHIMMSMRELEYLCIMCVTPKSNFVMTEKNDYFMNIEVFNSDIFLHRKKKCPSGEKGFCFLNMPAALEGLH